MSTSLRKCRWGILGAAFIARKNWQAIHNSGNAVLVAVASRDAARCQSFISECQAQARFDPPPRAMTSYDELIQSPDIDAVYIPLPTGTRKEWVLRAAAAGKHVLVEKPVGRTVADVEEMIAACRKHNVQFMDGVMFMHSLRLKRMRATLDDPASIGDIRRIASQFSFRGDEEFLRSNIRTHSSLEPLGALGDLGWYCIRFSLWALNYAMPTAVTGAILSSHSPNEQEPAVPTEFSGELFFPDGVSAAFYCSFQTAHEQWGAISGTRGYLHVDDFVLPFHGSETRFTLTRSIFKADGCQADMHEGRETTQVREPGNNEPEAQETRLFRNFSSLALAGKPDWTWADITLKTQRIMDACLRSAMDGGARATPL